MPRPPVRAFRLAPTVLGLFALAAAVGASEFYVSPGGSGSNSGMAASPWDLATALSQPSAVKPGDTIWLRGGTYRGTFTSYLTGTAANPILVRQYPGERATIDGGDSGGNGILLISGSYTWYWGFEVMSSDLNRVSTQVSSWPTDIARGEAIQINQVTGSGVGTKFINLIVHDTRQGFSFWKEAIDAEISGCLIYNNGWIAPDRGHGHGIYTQNNTGTKRITDNILFNQFGYGIHAYGSSTASLNNFTIQGNASFNNGSLAGQHNPNIFVGGGAAARHIDVLDNATYARPLASTSVRLGSDAANEDLRIEGNTFVGFTSVRNWSHVVVSNNVLVGSPTLAEFRPTRALESGDYVWNRNRYVSQEGPWQPFELLTGPARGLTFAAWKSATGFDAASLYARGTPSGNRVLVRRDRYEPGRAQIVVYNWARASSVALDPEEVVSVGSAYEVRNAQDYFGPPASRGVYDGRPIVVSLNGRAVARPIGAAAADSTAPEFNVFLLLGQPAARSGPSPPPTQPRRERGRARSGKTP